MAAAVCTCTIDMRDGRVVDREEGCPEHGAAALALARARLEDGRLVVKVTGRPAPQGSKRTGEHGQMREQSPYLPAWRAAVKRDTYRAYRDLGIGPEELPLFAGPVGVAITFYLAPEQLPQARIDGPPDYDKLQRATWDALTQARVFEDDGRIVEVGKGAKVLAAGFGSGAVIEVWRVSDA